MDVVRVRHAFYNKAAYNLSEAYFHDIDAVTGKFTSEDNTVLVDNAMKAVEAELADTFPPKALDLAFKISQLVGGGRWSWEALGRTQLNSALEVFGSLETLRGFLLSRSLYALTLLEHLCGKPGPDKPSHPLTKLLTIVKVLANPGALDAVIMSDLRFFNNGDTLGDCKWGKTWSKMVTDLIDGGDTIGTLLKSDAEWERTRSTAEIQNKRMTIVALKAELGALGEQVKPTSTKEDFIKLLADAQMLQLRATEKECHVSQQQTK